MTKQEQIEEMAKNYCKNGLFCGKFCQTDGCRTYETCETLYNACYRKIDDKCAVITKDELKQYKVQAVKEFSERLKTEPRITDSGLEFVALVDIDAELEALLKEYEKWKTISIN